MTTPTPPSPSSRRAALSWARVRATTGSELWAPVGLRYHALQHLLPGIPYHALPLAHRRLASEMGVDSAYHGANYGGLWPLVGRLWASSWRGGATPRS